MKMKYNLKHEAIQRKQLEKIKEMGELSWMIPTRPLVRLLKMELSGASICSRALRMASPQGCFTWQLGSSEPVTQERAHYSFYNLTFKIPSYYFGCILLLKSELLNSAYNKGAEITNSK